MMQLPYLDIGIPIPHIFGLNAGDLFKDIALYAQTKGVSDIFIQPSQPICFSIQGQLKAIMQRNLDVQEVWNLLTIITDRHTAKTDMMSGNSVNASYVIQSRTELINYMPKRYYYRVNATAIASGNGLDCAQIVMRSIPSQPLHHSQIDLNAQILQMATPKSGIVYIAGATGSGKTTTFSAILRYILEENTPIKGNIVTYEEPIEFRYDTILSQHSIITQSEIPRHVPSFYAGVREAMRRKPELIMIGELRDEETIMSAMEASLTGHTVFGTIHATNVASILNRLIYRLPEAERQQAMYKLIDATRFMLAQRLIQGIDGKRVALREYLAFDTDMVEHLLALPNQQLINQEIRAYIHSKGHSFSKDALRLFQANKIDEKTLQEVYKMEGKAL